MIMGKSKSLMIQGTSSHVGKSITAAAICRILKQDGYSVCPFKSQNMALNSFITASGGEMGRAQVVQAEACGLEPEVEMNPILIKPVADQRAQIIFMGKVVRNMSAAEYNKNKIFYINRISEIISGLKKRFDYIIIEGAGSPAEINLLKNDIVNMKTAELAGSPVLLVGDVDRGGVFASFYGTVKLLPFSYRKYIKGLLVNKFRGDVSLLKPGNDYIARKLRIPVVGTIPYYRDIFIEEEDSVNIEREKDKKTPAHFAKKGSKGRSTIGVIYLPHISNFTDFNPFQLEKDVNLLYIKNKDELRDLNPHLVIIPGSKSTIDDLLYLRRSGLEKEIKKQFETGSMVMGICGGYQMLGRTITDKFKSESSDIQSINGLGLMDIETVFLSKKNTYQVGFELSRQFLKQSGSGFTGGSPGENRMAGYEIHMGLSKKVHPGGSDMIPLFNIKSRGKKATGISDGFIRFNGENNTPVLGTYIHGVFDNYIFRKIVIGFLRKIHKRGQEKPGPGLKSYKDFKEAQYDALALLFRENMDMRLFYKILKHGL